MAGCNQTLHSYLFQLNQSAGMRVARFVTHQTICAALHEPLISAILVSHLAMVPL